MPFEPGHKKLGGRKKGTSNKKTQALAEIFTDRKFHLPSEIIKLLPELDPALRMDALLKLLEYVYPKRRAMEVSEAKLIGDPLAGVSDEELDKLPYVVS